MNELDPAQLLALYRSVLGDVMPDSATADELACVIAGLSKDEARRLDLALQDAGVDELLATVCPVSTETEWADDNTAFVYTAELGERGREYLNKMIADGPVGLGPPAVKSNDC